MSLRSSFYAHCTHTQRNVVFARRESRPVRKHVENVTYLAVFFLVGHAPSIGGSISTINNVDEMINEKHEILYFKVYFILMRFCQTLKFTFRFSISSDDNMMSGFFGNLGIFDSSLGIPIVDFLCFLCLNELTKQ